MTLCAYCWRTKGIKSSKWKKKGTNERGWRREQLRDQLEVLQGMWEDSQQETLQNRAEGRAARNHWEGELKLTKISEQNDIEAYLTTYEQMMVIYEVSEER